VRRLLQALRSERGEFSLPGTLVAITLFGTVLGATLDTYGHFDSGAQELVQRTDASDQARTASDRIARALRNLASPAPDQPQAFDLASANDMVFKTVDPVGPNTGQNTSNTRRVRYCLAGDGRLWEQVQTWTTATMPAVPSTTACPGSGWGSQEVVAQDLVNTAQHRDVFTYDSTVLTQITTIGLELWTDADTKDDVPPSVLRTGVFLRNQNRRPVAGFTATPTQQGIVLNGSASYDPEGQALTYAWYDGASQVGTGVAYTYAATHGTSHQISLKVFDPAGLEGDAPAQTVTA
jgi:type II secretory pathway pseudopilin PulG